MFIIVTFLPFFRLSSFLDAVSFECVCFTARILQAVGHTLTNASLDQILMRSNTCSYIDAGIEVSGQVGIVIGPLTASLLYEVHVHCFSHLD